MQVKDDVAGVKPVSVVDIAAMQGGMVGDFLQQSASALTNLPASILDDKQLGTLALSDLSRWSHTHACVG